MYRIRSKIMIFVSMVCLWLSAGLPVVAQRAGTGVSDLVPVGEVVVLLDSSAQMSRKFGNSVCLDVARWCLVDLAHACPDSIPIRFVALSDGAAKMTRIDSLCPLGRSQLVRKAAECVASGNVDFDACLHGKAFDFNEKSSKSKWLIFISGGQGFDTESASRIIQDMRRKCDVPCKFVVVGTCEEERAIIALKQLALSCQGSFIQQSVHHEYQTFIKEILLSLRSSSQSSQYELLLKISETQSKIQHLEESSQRRFQELSDRVSEKFASSHEELKSIRTSLQLISQELSGSRGSESLYSLVESMKQSVSLLEQRTNTAHEQIAKSQTLLLSIKNGENFSDSLSLAGLSAAIKDLRETRSNANSTSLMPWWLPWILFPVVGTILGFALARWFQETFEKRDNSGEWHRRIREFSRELESVRQSTLEAQAEWTRTMRAELRQTFDEWKSQLFLSNPPNSVSNKPSGECCREVKQLLSHMECQLKRGRDRLDDLAERIQNLTIAVSQRTSVSDRPPNVAPIEGNFTALFAEIQKLRTDMFSHRNELEVYVQRMLKEHCSIPTKQGSLSIQDVGRVPLQSYGESQETNRHESKSLSSSIAELTRLTGIDQKIAMGLVNEGVRSLHAMANLSEAEIEDILSRSKMFDRASLIHWTNQAKNA